MEISVACHMSFRFRLLSVSFIEKLIIHAKSSGNLALEKRQGVLVGHWDG